MNLHELEAKWREQARQDKADSSGATRQREIALLVTSGTYKVCADELDSMLAQVVADEALPWKLDWHADGAGGGHYKIVNANGVIVEPSRIVKFANQWAKGTR